MWSQLSLSRYSHLSLRGGSSEEALCELGCTHCASSGPSCCLPLLPTQTRRGSAHVTPLHICIEVGLLRGSVSFISGLVLILAWDRAPVASHAERASSLNSDLTPPAASLPPQSFHFIFQNLPPDGHPVRPWFATCHHLLSLVFYENKVKGQ